MIGMKKRFVLSVIVVMIVGIGCSGCGLYLVLRLKM